MMQCSQCPRRTTEQLCMPSRVTFMRFCIHESGANVLYKRQRIAAVRQLSANVKIHLTSSYNFYSKMYSQTVLGTAVTMHTSSTHFFVKRYLVARFCVACVTEGLLYDSLWTHSHSCLWVTNPFLRLITPIERYKHYFGVWCRSWDPIHVYCPYSFQLFPMSPAFTYPTDQNFIADL